jgi:ribonuclease G
MAEEILINVTPREVRIAFIEQGVLQDIYIERRTAEDIVGNIYKGKVTRLLPGIQAAFVDVGLKKSAFLHIQDINTDKITQDIRDLLHPGQEVLVQVSKNPLGTKGARLTQKFTLPSRYLVLTPCTQELQISQKIVEVAEQQRLLSLIERKEQSGYIFRTAAQNATSADLRRDQAYLEELWQTIKAKASKTTVGQILYAEIAVVLRLLRDLGSTEIQRIRVDDLEVVEQMRNFATHFSPSLIDKIEFYEQLRPIFDIHSVEDELQKALQRKVFLKSGGHIIVEQTEAMTTIDVNTGSYIGHGIIEETIFKTNLEAADTIARQVRLRNLGGIIIIDFIDMQNSQHKAQLREALDKALLKDKARVEVSELSSLGLLQMTRKRTRESLEHILCVTCPTCKRRGSIKSFETICYDILREIKRIANLFPWAGFLVLAPEGVINTFKETENLMLSQLASELQRPIKLQSENSYKNEQWDVLPLTNKESS